MLSGDPLHYVFPVAPPEGEKTLSVLTLPERENTLCVQPPPKRGKTVCTPPTGEGEDSVCTVPSRGGENSVCIGYIQPSSAQKCTYPRKVTKAASGGQTEAVPSGVGKARLPPVNNRADKRRIQVALQRMPKLIQGTLHSQQLRKLRQTKCLMDLYSRPAAERRSRSRSYPRQSGILQPSLPGSKTRQLLEASHRSKCTKQIPGHPKIQDGDPRVHPSLPQKRGVGHIHRPHRRLPTCTYSLPVSKIPRVSFPRYHLPIHQPTFRASNSPPHFHQYSQGSKTDSLTIRDQAPPIPGRLVDPCSLKARMHGTNSKTTKAGEGFGLYSQPQEVRTRPFPEVQLPRIPFFTRFGSCEAHARQVDETSGDVPSPLLEDCYQCKDSYVHQWLTCINGEDCEIGQDTHETFSVASQNSLEISDASGHTNTLESEDDTTRGMVVRPSKCDTRRISPPQGTRKTDIYRRLKRRLGRSLRSKFYRRGLVSHREASSHQPIRTEGGSSGSTILPNRLQKQSSPYRPRQHLGGGLHQQTGRHKVSRTLCSNVENPHLVSPKQCHTQSETRSGFTQCNTRSNQQSGPYLHWSSNKFPNFGRVPKWTCSQLGWTQNFLHMSLKLQILRLGQ